ncbi:MAG: hypothetical protein H7144_10565 [Burkholderiales bacterium]|nr:hypothetical protein [Phycisphaerae bacterium]
MALSPEQSSRVKYLLDVGWGRKDVAESDEEPAYWTDFDRVLAEVESHEFVDHWNWGRWDGADPGSARHHRFHDEIEKTAQSSGSTAPGWSAPDTLACTLESSRSSSFTLF